MQNLKKTNERLASKIRVRCIVCKRLLEADSSDLQLVGDGKSTNSYFYIKCPACRARIIIPPESWPVE